MDAIPENEWKAQAEAQPLGTRRKVQHCGADASMIVSNNADHLRAHCFRCHGWGYIKKERNLTEILARLAKQQEAEAEAAASLDLPNDCKVIGEGWPYWARLWLAKAGLGSSDVERLGFLYSPRMNRVVMPIRDKAGQLVFWQARGDKVAPKYLSPTDVNRREVIPIYGRHESVVFLTEDILSAAKVGQVALGWSLMGTVMHQRVLLSILDQKLKVIVGLDPDAAGVGGAADTMQRLLAYGVPCKNVTSSLPCDPKNMSRGAIRQLILEVKNECGW